MENQFRRKIDSHITSLPEGDARFQKFNTSPYVLLIHARNRSYTRISEIESDILPAKQFSSMETSAGRYGTPKASNKKDWHILRNIREKQAQAITVDPADGWNCAFQEQGISVDVTVRIGLDWWEHLGGPNCFIEVFSALIRACIAPGNPDSAAHQYVIADLRDIVSTATVGHDYNVSLLQRGQLPWLFLIARHFCDELVE
ncbi:MAG: hypothetical protein P9E24_15165 [Candidatus Competibacter sp.]|nr:hypothetical protein [Candidatus Competibacter sp.]MDG4583517.1 hypothetical protein [Candidatus Competibacter sp.]